MLPAVALFLDASIVDPTRRALPRQRRVNYMPILTAVGGKSGLASFPRILRPEQFGAALCARRGADESVVHRMLDWGT